MPRDMLRDGLAKLTRKMATHASRQVLYVRDAESVTVRAVFGQKLLKLDDGEGGIRMEWTDIDFLIPSVDLVLAGERIEPQRGDRIEVVEPGEPRRIYEVFPYGGEAAWSWSDPHRSMLRVRCKHIDDEGDC